MISSLGGATTFVPLIGGAEGTTLIWFVGFVLLSVLSLWLTYVAYRVSESSPASQDSLWSYYVLVGGVGLLVGIIGSIRALVSDPPMAFAALLPTLLVGYTFTCALAIREAQTNAVYSNTESERFGEYPTRRGAEAGIILGILGIGLPPLFFDVTASAVLSVLLAPVVVGYGGYYFQKHIRGSATHGTLIDTLLRHTILSLVFFSLVIVGIGGLLLVPESVLLDSLGATFLVMGTTSLVAVVVKFRQHATGL